MINKKKSWGATALLVIGVSFILAGIGVGVGFGLTSYVGIVTIKQTALISFKIYPLVIGFSSLIAGTFFGFGLIVGSKNLS